MTRSPSTKRRGRGVRRSSSHRPGRRTSLPTARGRPRGIRTSTLVKQLGRRRWKKVSGYHRQGRVVNTFFRYTSIIGDGLRARSPAGQGSEAVLGCAILNPMTELGRPVVIAHRPVRILSVGIVRARDDSCNNAPADVYEGRRVAILTRRERIKRRTLLGSHSLLLREGVMPWKGGQERAE